MEGRNDVSSQRNCETEAIWYFAATGKVVNDQAKTPNTKPARNALPGQSRRAVENNRGYIQEKVTPWMNIAARPNRTMTSARYNSSA